MKKIKNIILKWISQDSKKMKLKLNAIKEI